MKNKAEIFSTGSDRSPQAVWVDVLVTIIRLDYGEKVDERELISEMIRLFQELIPQGKSIIFYRPLETSDFLYIHDLTELFDDGTYPTRHLGFYFSAFLPALFWKLTLDDLKSLS